MEKEETKDRKSEINVPLRVKETKSLKLKRFIASKMSEFKSGRRAIHRFTGNIGIQIMDALYSCFVKFSNVRVAQAMQVNVYKVATKTAVFIHEKIITEEMMRTCKESNMLLLFCLIEQLQTPIHLRQPEVIISLTTDCFNSIRSLLEPLPGSSFDRLVTIYTFATNDGFINFFHHSPDIELERIVILNNLLGVMAPYEQDAKQLTIFLKDQLQLRRKELCYLLDKPQLIHFLRRTETFQLLQQWLQNSSSIIAETAGINWLMLYTDIKGYISVTSHHLLPSRAEYIINKYLDSSITSTYYIPLPEDILGRIHAAVDSENYTKNLFTEILTLIVSHLSKPFEEEFLQSEYYGRLERELELIDMKIMAFFHEDPSTLYCNDKEEREELKSTVQWNEFGGMSSSHENNRNGPSMFERISFWQG